MIMNSAKKLLRKLEVIKIEEEKTEKKRDPLPGEPGHYRYEKDKKVGPDKATTTDTFKKKETIPVKEEVPVKDKIYSKTAVKDKTRAQQEAILTEREVKFSDKDKELALIGKILNSNPKK